MTIQSMHRNHYGMKTVHWYQGRVRAKLMVYTITWSFNMFTFLSLFACTEYGFHNKNATNLGGGDSQSASDGSGFDFTTDSLIEDEPEYNSLVGRVCSPTGGDWIVDAHVYVEVDTNDDGVIDYISEDYTNLEGFYTLNDLPEGEHIVYVSKGSFSKEIVSFILGFEVILFHLIHYSILLDYLIYELLNILIK